LKYRNEEELLAVQEDPERYNREYIENYSFFSDIGYILRTVLQIYERQRPIYLVDREP